MKSIRLGVAWAIAAMAIMTNVAVADAEAPPAPPPKDSPAAKSGASVVGGVDLRLQRFDFKYSDAKKVFAIATTRIYRGSDAPVVEVRRINIGEKKAGESHSSNLSLYVYDSQEPKDLLAKRVDVEVEVFEEQGKFDKLLDALVTMAGNKAVQTLFPKDGHSWDEIGAVLRSADNVLCSYAQSFTRVSGDFNPRPDVFFMPPPENNKNVVLNFWMRVVSPPGS